MWVYLAEAAPLFPPASVVHMCLVLLILLPSYTRLDRPLNRPRRLLHARCGPRSAARAAIHHVPEVLHNLPVRPGPCFCPRLLSPPSFLCYCIMWLHFCTNSGSTATSFPGAPAATAVFFFHSAVTFNSIVAVAEKPTD